MSGVMSPTTNSAKRTEARCENVYTYISMGEVDMNGEYVHDEDECGVYGDYLWERRLQRHRDYGARNLGGRLHRKTQDDSSVGGRD